MNFLINEDPDSFASDFAAAHGPSASGFAIRFNKPVGEVFDVVLGNGGEAVSHKPDSKAVDAPVVKGIGDCMLYLVDAEGGDLYRDFVAIDGVDQDPVSYTHLDVYKRQALSRIA